MRKRRPRSKKGKKSKNKGGEGEVKHRGPGKKVKKSGGGGEKNSVKGRILKIDGKECLKAEKSQIKALKT